MAGGLALGLHGVLAHDAAQRGPLARLLLDHERRAAAGKRDQARPVPHRERAIRVAGAAVEDLAALRAPLGDLADLALGACDPERERLGEVAVGPPLARNEAAEWSDARHQPGATL